MVHVFYPELWESIRERLEHLPLPYDLYVTTPASNVELKRSARDLSPQARIEVVENRGYDVAPFILIINKIPLDRYDYIIKLHTKRDMRWGSQVNGYDCFGAKWRNWSFSFLEKRALERCLRAFHNDPTLGMVGNYHLIYKKKDRLDKEAVRRATELLTSCGLKCKRFRFVAGTMFMCRAKLLKPLQELNLSFCDFEPSTTKHEPGLAHAVERFIGYAVDAQGMKIRDAGTAPIVLLIGTLLSPFRVLGQFLYKKRINRKGEHVIKICEITVYRRTSPTHTPGVSAEA